MKKLCSFFLSALILVCMALPVFATAPSEDLTSSEITEWDLGNNMVLVAGEPTVIETTEDNSSNRAISPRTTRTYSYPFYIRFEGESRNNIIFTATVRTFGTSGDWIFLDNGTYTYTVNNTCFLFFFWENTYVNSSRTILQAAFGYDYLGQKNYSPAIRFTVDNKRRYCCLPYDGIFSVPSVPACLFFLKYTLRFFSYLSISVSLNIHNDRLF